MAIYVKRGLDPALAKQVAEQLTAHDALAAHARDELGFSDTLSARLVQAALAFSEPAQPSSSIHTQFRSNCFPMYGRPATQTRFGPTEKKSDETKPSWRGCVPPLGSYSLIITAELELPAYISKIKFDGSVRLRCDGILLAKITFGTVP